jgi:hypothetical protein
LLPLGATGSLLPVLKPGNYGRCSIPPLAASCQTAAGATLVLEMCSVYGQSLGSRPKQGLRRFLIAFDVTLHEAACQAL